MHLTNYSVNKHNENFERDETVDKGSKRSINWFTEFLRTNDYDVAKFWGDISVRVQSTKSNANINLGAAEKMCITITKTLCKDKQRMSFLSILLYKHTLFLPTITLWRQYTSRPAKV